MKLQVLLGVYACALPLCLQAEDRPAGDAPSRPMLEKMREERKKNAERGEKFARPPHEGDMFALLDKDKDGVINAEEFFASPRMEKLPQEQRDKLFSRIDSDGDGKITPEEIRKMHRPGEGEGDMFAMMDKDKDGFVSAEEFAASPRMTNLPQEERDKIFAKVDKDGDGKVSAEEIRKMRQESHERHMRELRELDTDNSGGLSYDELSKGKFFSQLPEEKRKQIFERMDTNSDGQITPEDRPKGPRPNPEGRPDGERKPNPEGRPNPDRRPNPEGRPHFDRRPNPEDRPTD